MTCLFCSVTSTVLIMLQCQVPSWGIPFIYYKTVTGILFIVAHTARRESSEMFSLSERKGSISQPICVNLMSL